MINSRLKLALFCMALHNFTFTVLASAADQVAPQPYPNSWCYGMHWPSYGWIFPVLFFVIMFVIFFLVMRRRGMGCGWGERTGYGPWFGANMQQPFNQQPESAMEILNKRYAKGEIDKQEYEEKKAAISPVHENNND